MPAKLKNLVVTKVDFVDAGDNKRAAVMLFKRKQESATFDDKLAERDRRQAADEMWDYCWMLNDSLCSIFWDDEIPDEDKVSQMERSVDEFVTATKGAIPQWVKGALSRIAKEQPVITPERLTFAKETCARLIEWIAKAEKEASPEDDENEGPDTEDPDEEGETEEMKINKSKLSPEELAFLEMIEKKAGIAAEPSVSDGTAVPDTEPVPITKAASTALSGASEGDPEGDEDIYKGLHPAVRAELERLRKQADAAEERELYEIAKKYEIIGKKAEELVPVLKNLKATGGEAYEQMIAVLDASVEAVEKSALFSEVGKRGTMGGTGADNAWAQIEKHAEAIQKAAPTMPWVEAVDKACEQHPDLVHEYESGR